MAEYIEREALSRWLHETMSAQTTTVGMACVRDFWNKVLDTPAKDVAPVVRCKDCIHYEMRSKESGYCYFWDHEQGMEPNRVVYDDFCSYGERNGGGT